MFFTVENADKSLTEYKWLAWSTMTLHANCIVPCAILLNIKTKEITYISVTNLKLLRE